MDQDGSAGGINIRGVEGDYNSFQIDGNRLPSSGGGRGINARQFAAGGITRIEVIKAPTPDRDGDAIGGIINVVSRSAFQRSDREFEFDAAGGYGDLPEKWGHAFELKYSDIFSIGGGAGLLTGVITTQSIADATLAANYAHSNDRAKWGEIFPHAL